MSEQQIERLRMAYSGFETISMDKATKLMELMDQFNINDLVQLAQAKIKFVSSLAVNRCARGNVKWRRE